MDDPTFLWLSEARLKRFGKRCCLIPADFLGKSWPDTIGGKLAAVVSTQTFHMLDADQLAPLYHQIAQEAHPDGDDRDGFWENYAAALGIDLSDIHDRLYGGRKRRKKERLPLAWHLNQLLDNGFATADCFWRREYNAVFGGHLTS